MLKVAKCITYHTTFTTQHNRYHKNHWWHESFSSASCPLITDTTGVASVQVWVVVTCWCWIGMTVQSVCLSVCQWWSNTSPHVTAPTNLGTDGLRVCFVPQKYLFWGEWVFSGWINHMYKWCVGMTQWEPVHATSVSSQQLSHLCKSCQVHEDRKNEMIIQLLEYWCS